MRDVDTKIGGTISNNSSTILKVSINELQEGIKQPHLMYNQKWD